MKRFTSFVGLWVLLAAPAQAQDATVEVCARALTEAMDSVTGTREFGGNFAEIMTLTNDGFCVLKPGDQPDPDFAVAFRAEGLAEAVEAGVLPSRALVRIGPVELSQEINGSRGQGMVSFSYQHDADSRRLFVDELALTPENGTPVTVSAELGPLDLSSPTAMRMGLFGMRAYRVTTNLPFEPWSAGGLLKSVMDGLALGDAASLEDRQWARTELLALIDGLPEGTFTPGSAEALSSALGSLPNGRGMLRINMTSESGLGLFQFASGLANLQATGLVQELNNEIVSATDPDFDDESERFHDMRAQALEVILSGVVIEVQWDPAN